MAQLTPARISELRGELARIAHDLVALNQAINFMSIPIDVRRAFVATASTHQARALEIADQLAQPTE